MKSLMEELVEETGIRPEILRVVVTRTMAHLHRGFYENGEHRDYAGGPLAIDLGSRAYLHFLAMVLCLAEDYSLDEPGEFAEYGHRIVPRDVHDSVLEEMDAWQRREPR